MATLRFHVVPNAKSDKIVGEHGEALKIKLRAAAIEGKANRALRCFLAEELKIPERAIMIERGTKSRTKFVRINGLTDREVRHRLLASA